MATISVYRQAKKGQVSSFNHLLNTQDFQNQSLKNNPNKNNENLAYIVKDGNFIIASFKRNGNNQKTLDFLHKIEKQKDLEAREDYKKYKLELKKQNPDKKIRTVLQSKDLKKEFVIALGADKEIGNKKDFEKNILKTVDEVMKAKSLTRNNVITIVIHYDEKTPHIHCQYNDYSHSKHTTATMLECPVTTPQMTKEERSTAVKNARKEFGKFQDLVAENMGMERGLSKSQKKHTSKKEYQELEYQKLLAERNLLNQQCEKLREDTSKIRLNRDKLIEKMEAEKLKLHDDRLNFTTELSANTLLRGFKKNPKFANIDEKELASIYDSGISSTIQPKYEKCKEKAEKLNNLVQELEKNNDLQM